MWSRRVWTVAAVAVVAATVGAGRAQAQDFDREPALPTFPVAIRGAEPGVSVRLVGGTGEEIPCGERCVLELPVGRYRVLATAPNGRLSKQYLDVSRPSDVTVTPQDYAARNTGFVLMGVGLGGIGAGAGMTAVWLWWSMVVGFSCGEGGSPCDDSDKPPRWLLPTGLVALGGGLALGATGLILWRKNAHAGVSVHRLGAASLLPDRVGLHLLPVAAPRFTGMALTGSF